MNFKIAQKIVKNKLYGEQHMKNFIEALPDMEHILEIVSDFDDVTMLSLISTLIDVAAAKVGADPGELAHTILETVVAVNDEDGFIHKDMEV